MARKAYSSKIEEAAKAFTDGLAGAATMAGAPAAMATAPPPQEAAQGKVGAGKEVRSMEAVQMTKAAETTGNDFLDALFQKAVAKPTKHAHNYYIKDVYHEKFKEISERTGLPISDVVNKVLEAALGF